MRLLDLFCGAGGAAAGYYRAGFLDITGIDIKPQPHYPYKFIQGDALEYLAQHGGEYDFIHASPPCQRYSECTPVQYRKNHPDLIEPTRKLLQRTGMPYVIENVEGARFLLHNPVMLCGSMFGLKIWRHRYFEISFDLGALTPPCNHGFEPVLISGTTRRKAERGGRFEYAVEQRRAAAGIDWMTGRELDDAIPPVYTEFIGRSFAGVCGV